MTKNFFSKANGNRGAAPNVAVVIVDGWPTDKVEEASRFARESGINIFFITVEGATENEKQYVTEPNFSNKVRKRPRDPPGVSIHSLCTAVIAIETVLVPSKGHRAYLEAGKPPGRG